MSYKADFAPVPYEGEPSYIRVALLDIGGYLFKVLVNPTDQRRCLRLIVSLYNEEALDKSFGQISCSLHCLQTLANVLVVRVLESAGAKNVNVRYDGNSKFADNAENVGLHYHILGRFDDGDNVLGVYAIDYPPGTKGDIPLGTGQIPLSQDKGENIYLLGEISTKLRGLLEEAIEGSEGIRIVK